MAARLERDLSTAEDARLALAAAGIVIAKSTYAEYESGSKQPSKNHLPELERFFGPFADPVASEPQPDLASAILALTAELTAARLARAEYEVRLRAVESELESLRVRRGDAGSQERSAPPETAGLGR